MSLQSILFAASEKIDPGSIGVEPVTDANGAIAGLLTTVYGVAGMVCVVIIVMAGYMYTTSNGDAGSVKRAKDMILGAIVGIVVIIGAFVITQFVLGRF
jgi:hypothetical protein